MGDHRKTNHNRQRNSSSDESSLGRSVGPRAPDLRRWGLAGAPRDGGVGPRGAPRRGLQLASEAVSSDAGSAKTSFGLNCHPTCVSMSTASVRSEYESMVCRAHEPPRVGRNNNGLHNSTEPTRAACLAEIHRIG